MEPAQSKSNSDNQNSQKIFCKQPITCPWITTQPYPSSLNKNKTCDSTANKTLPNIPLTMESRTVNEKTCPSLQHSSSQFFYFLRLMQLFPETHPATLHTVLCLCKNDFFCAVDKLLYAKRCKALYSRSQGMFKRCSVGRSHPYCGHGTGKVVNQQEKTKINESGSGMKECVEDGKGSDWMKVQGVVENNLEVVEKSSSLSTTTVTKSHLSTIITTSPIKSADNNEEKQKTAGEDVTSPDGNSIEIEAQ